MASSARSPRHTVPDSLDAIEACYRRNWTDGLPVVPPIRLSAGPFDRF